jgi:hypothetical protein
MIRSSASPSAAAALERMNKEIDVRGVLAAIRVPTLVLNRTGDAVDIIAGSRELKGVPGEWRCLLSSAKARASASAGTPRGSVGRV